VNEKEICKEITELHDNILAAGVVEDQQLVAKYARDNMPEPDQERLKLTFARPEIVFSMLNIDADYVGAVRYVIICTERFDLIVFRHGSERESRFFFVRTKRNYRGEEILHKIFEYLDLRTKGQAQA
jgi:hypothetical protein